MTILDLLGINALRSVLAEKALNRAHIKAEQSIQDFKTNTLGMFVSLPKEARETVAELSDTNNKSLDLSQSALEEVQKMKLPETGKPVPLKDLKQDIENMGVGLKSIFNKTYNYKLQRLVRDQARQRMFKTKDQLANEMPIPLSPVDQEIVDVLDKTGIVDVATASGEVLMEEVPEGVLDMIDTASDFLFPGVVSGTKAVFKEIDMLLKDETDFGEALKKGIAPALAKSGLVATGAAIDSAAGWSTLGLFTLLGYVAGKLVKNSGPQKCIQADLAIMKPFLSSIQERKITAQGKINECVAENFSDFPGTVKSCPNFAEEPKLVEFVSQVIHSYSQDITLASASINESCEQAIEKLPKPNWVDRILNVDRPAKIAQLYRESAQEIVSVLNTDTIEIQEIASNNPVDSVLQLADKSLLSGGETIQILGTLTSVLPDMESDYEQSLEGWKKRCLEMWETGSQNIAVITKSENEGIASLVKELEPQMSEPRARIRANLNRLNLDASLCP